MADQCNGCTVSHLIVFGQQSPPAHRAHPQSRKVIAGHELRGESFHRVVVDEGMKHDSGETENAGACLSAATQIL
jgi:hypothetical protein